MSFYEILSLFIYLLFTILKNYLKHLFHRVKTIRSVNYDSMLGYYSFFKR